MSTPLYSAGSQLSSSSGLEKAGWKFTYLSLLLFPASVTVLPVVHGLIVLILIVAGMAFHLTGKNRTHRLTSEEKQFYFPVVAMALIAVLVTAFSGLETMEMKNLGKFLFLLMAIPLYVYFRNSRLTVPAIWYGLVLGACISAVVGVYEISFDVYKPGYFGRAKGATHPIIFGDLALLMGAMSMAGIGWFISRSRWQIVLPVLALCMGILASILSQSRGGWVAIPIFVAILLWASRKHISIRLQVLGVGALLVILLAGYFIPQTGMQKKIQTTIDNVNIYLDSDINDSRRATSIGARFEMWQASWQIFTRHPLSGVGWGNYQKHVQKLVDEGLRNPTAADWVHPHNQFLSAMVSGGIFALTAVCLLFYLPARIFVRAMHSHNPSADTRRLALAGLLLVVVFAVFNLSESFLERSRTVAFFIFYLAIFMAGIGQRQQPGKDQ